LKKKKRKKILNKQSLPQVNGTPIMESIITSLPSLETFTKECREAICASYIFYHGVSLQLGYSSAESILLRLKKLEQLHVLETKKVHAQFAKLWILLHKTNLATESLGLALQYQETKLLALLPEIRVFLPEVETPEDVIEFFLRYTYFSVYLKQDDKISNCDNWMDYYGIVVYGNVEEIDDSGYFSLVAYKCRNNKCMKLGTLYCSKCKCHRYCSKACQRQDWRLHKKSCGV